MRTLAVSGLIVVLTLGGVACGGDDASTETPADDGGGAASDSTFCEKARGYEEESQDADISYEDSLAAMQDVAGDAPDEIADDVDLLVELAQALVDAGDDPDVQAEVFQRFDEPRYAEAGQNFLAYLQDECGIATDA